jgi:hypothetical protein
MDKYWFGFWRGKEFSLWSTGELIGKNGLNMYCSPIISCFMFAAL